jgi:hypothetical protein
MMCAIARKQEKDDGQWVAGQGTYASPVTSKPSSEIQRNSFAGFPHSRHLIFLTTRHPYRKNQSLSKLRAKP